MPLILTCLDIIELMTRRVDHHRRILLNYEGQHVANYQPYWIHQMYHFKEPEIKVIEEWMQSRDDILDYLTQRKGLWDKGNFISKPFPIGWLASKF